MSDEYKPFTDAMIDRMFARTNAGLLAPSRLMDSPLFCETHTHYATTAPTRAPIDLDAMAKLIAEMGPPPVPMKLYQMPFAALTKQKRRHRKTRINRKWRKRYGFRTVPNDRENQTVRIFHCGMDSDSRFIQSPPYDLAVCGFTVYERIRKEFPNATTVGESWNR